MSVYWRTRVVVVVPAYNEAATIANTIRALLAQTRPVDRLIVVPNNCSDDTAKVAWAAGAEVWEMPGPNPHKKAGALNWAINLLLPQLDDRDMLLVTDADSILAPGAVTAGIRELGRRGVGAVCADYRLGRQPRLLDILQGNEYARFSRWIWRKGGKAIVLSGVATLFPVPVVRRIMAARASGDLPGYPGEFYHRDPATEDIEMTFAVQSMGYRPRVAPGFDAITDSMPTVQALITQRVRWQRGMLDSLRLYGLRWWNVGNWLRQLGIYTSSLLVPLYVITLIVSWFLMGFVAWDPRWLPITAVFVLERVVTVRRQGWWALLTAAALLPEWCYEQVRSFAYWRALAQTVCGTDRVWINS
ncbi:Glycosyltransferase, catalytic subunit of cellulose synthase and poly-beta-1,6-N-acetylglucosamine synthase [Micromonospora echinaurantiaca]|uniref:Glycosyltransferase, catalytic subunit of cellulose synthase and poly-beta-1,6-N-acetylglucosamine synthase n=1 Tax=Micromonospora echinaurantiaca TaxID=47857 RepID=A0A1C5I5U0_9ACTN|nr:glycosyltransferase family 2 protein [Micromonospora echinaurantiaca]SCG53567.1 Glycosyltransferase, catalytic subunit of cellulose synthase and poly-beta-1,6-N-acetylglucosamine synthase [Micromonospora echinaurantiaca]